MRTRIAIILGGVLIAAVLVWLVVQVRATTTSPSVVVAEPAPERNDENEHVAARGVRSERDGVRPADDVRPRSSRQPEDPANPASRGSHEGMPIPRDGGTDSDDEGEMKTVEWFAPPGLPEAIAKQASVAFSALNDQNWDLAKKEALAILATHPEQHHLAAVVVMASCGKGDKATALEYAERLAGDRPFMARRCRERGVEIGE